MSTLMVAVVAAVLLWLLGLWPFNRSYAYVPTLADLRQKRIEPPVDNKPSE